MRLGTRKSSAKELKGSIEAGSWRVAAQKNLAYELYTVEPNMPVLAFKVLSVRPHIPELVCRVVSWRSEQLGLTSQECLLRNWE